MKPATAKANLNFQQACQLAISIDPALRHDLEITANKRKEQARDMQGIGRTALDIPEPLLKLAYDYFPDLNSPDKEISAKAWLKFMQSSDAEIFRCNAKL